jgi:hypothetical protein
VATEAEDDQVAAGAEEEEDGEAEATTATTTHLHHILHTLLAPSHPRNLLLVPPPGALASLLARRQAQRPATQWATATTAVPRPVKQDRQTGLEMEAGRNLGLHGRLEGVDRLRVLHHLAARGMNRLVSGEVAGDSSSSLRKNRKWSGVEWSICEFCRTRRIGHRTLSVRTF